ncbi:MAG: ComEA family DNA-binding protein [Thermomicrobiales bacterium]
MNNHETLISIAPAATTQGQTVTVFVGGAVVRPGVYTLPRGERIEGAIAAAGGFAPEADQDGINRALLLRDEAQIVVPRKGEPTATALRPVAGVSAAPVATAARATARGSATPSGPINVNTASATELEQLPGVGAKIAQDIVAYRAANGPFANAADLAKVSGISDRMVAGWGELITFGP